MSTPVSISRADESSSPFDRLEDLLDSNARVVREYDAGRCTWAVLVDGTELHWVPSMGWTEVLVGPRRRFEVKAVAWARGDSFNSGLLTQFNTSCCLGFLAAACGASDAQISRVLSPAGAPRLSWPSGILVPIDPGLANSEITSQLMEVNDDPDITDDLRRRLLAELFWVVGLEPVFV